MKVDDYWCLLVAMTALAAACNQRSETAATNPPPLDEKAKCQCGRGELSQQASVLLAKSDAREALKVLGPCQNHIDDAEFRQLLATVRAAIAKLDLDAIPSDQKVARLAALQLWEGYAGTIPEPYEAELKQLSANDARRRKNQEAAAAQIAKMDFWDMCVEAGRIVRTPDEKRVPPRADAILGKAGFSARDEAAVRSREVVLGMDECALAAALGKPESMNRSVGSYGRHDQWVYRRGSYAYVYTENGKVRSYQQ